MAFHGIRRSSTFTALALILLASCAKPFPEGHVAVRGRVTLSGEPLTGAVVTFTPDGKTAGQGGGARTDTEGRYQVVDHTGAAGIGPGSYRVTISKLVGPDGEDFTAVDVAPMDADAREMLPGKYSDMAETILDARVADDSEPFNFDLSADDE